MYDKFYCPHCKTQQLVYLGNWRDDTSAYSVCAKCYNCELNFLLGEDEYERRELLYEIVFNNYPIFDDEVDDGYTIVDKIVDELLNGGLRDGLNLSDFLEKHSWAEKGEPLAKQIG